MCGNEDENGNEKYIFLLGLYVFRRNFIRLQLEKTIKLKPDHSMNLEKIHMNWGCVEMRMRMRKISSSLGCMFSGGTLFMFNSSKVKAWAHYYHFIAQSFISLKNILHGQNFETKKKEGKRYFLNWRCMSCCLVYVSTYPKNHGHSKCLFN